MLLYKVFFKELLILNLRKEWTCTHTLVSLLLKVLFSNLRTIVIVLIETLNFQGPVELFNYLIK